MRDPKRIERILSLINQIWTKQPDTRFNQLIHNLTWEYSKRNNDAHKEWVYSKWETEKGIQFTKDVVFVDCFHLEDDKFEDFLESKINE
jgi:uncharacterized protein YihD (DUF1040 family)